MTGPTASPNPAKVSMTPTTVDILPGKLLVEITYAAITNAVSPNAVAHLTARQVQKNTFPFGSKFRNPKDIILIPVKNNPKMNTFLGPTKWS